jgi:hypothetical protein
MSWENDDILPADIPAVAPAAPKPSSAEKRRKAKEIASAMKSIVAAKGRTERAGKMKRLERLEGPDVLDLASQGLDSLPVDSPKYATAKYLVLRDNDIHTLNAAALPRGLIALDMRKNGLRTITGDFPESLEYLFLDNNRLREVPTYPEGVVECTITGNPLRGDNVIQNMLEDITERTILWLTTEGERDKISEEDLAELGPRLLIYPDDIYLKVCMDSKTFIRKSICRDQISDEYMDSHLSTTKHLLIEVVNRDVVGMAIFDVRADTIFVHLLCASPRAPGGGTRLMKMLKQYMRNHPQLAAIRLESVAGAKAFYTKIGFTPCFDGHLCPMEFRRVGLSSRSGSRKSARASGSKTRKTKPKTD